MNDSSLHLFSAPVVDPQFAVLSEGPASNGSREGRSIDIDIVTVLKNRPSPERPSLAGLQDHFKIRLLQIIDTADLKNAKAPAEKWLTMGYSGHETALESRIQEFLSYSHGWDGEEAKAIPEDAVYASLNFLNEVRSRLGNKEPNSAAPSPDGEIVLYWHSPYGYAEVNFVGNGCITFCWGEDDGDIEVMEEKFEVNFEPDQSPIWKALSKFLNNKHNV